MTDKHMLSWKNRIAANALANIKRLDRAIKGPHGYQLFRIFEPLENEELSTRLEALRNERITHVELLTDLFGLEYVDYIEYLEQETKTDES